MATRLLLLTLAVGLLPGYALIRTNDGEGPYLRWTRGFEIPIHIDGRGHPRLAFGAVRAALEAGLTRWHQPDTSARFVRDPNGRDGDSPAVDGINLVRFESRRLPPEVDPAHTLAFTSPVSGACTGVLLEVDITFNAIDVRWSTNPGRDEYDLESVMVHEVGHLLGLDHTGVEQAIMFPTIGPRTLKRDPAPDDLAGLRAVYGPDRGQDCTANAQCARDETCLFSLRSDGDFATFCGPPVGRAAPGQRCAPEQPICDNGCANGLCLADGQCSAVCRGDDDCPQGQVCLAQDVGGGQTVPLCLRLQRCEGDLDGCPPGQACGLAAHPSEPRLLALCVEAGAAPTGAPCAAGADCAGGVCYAGTCSPRCEGPGDCPADRPCAEVSIPLPGGGSAPAALCRPSDVPCSRLRDCPVTDACTYQAVGGRTEGRCLTASGGDPGAACARDADCASRLCLVDGRCSTPCASDRDCPADMRCDRIRLGDTRVPACVSAPAPTPDQGPGEPRDQDPGAPEPTDGGPPPPDARPARDAAPSPRDDARPPGEPGRPDGGRPVVIVQDGGGGGGCRAAPGAPVPPAALGLLVLLALLGPLTRLSPLAPRRRR